jgi:hypothetical protein
VEGEGTFICDPISPVMVKVREGNLETQKAMVSEIIKNRRRERVCRKI